MGEHHNPASSVVVGIDGSPSALAATLWAVDEALGADVPLRLVYAIDPARAPTHEHPDASGVFAKAEIAIQGAVAAIESTEQPVKVEVEVLISQPEHALLAAAGNAAMVCVGATGIERLQNGGIGSTPAALAGVTPCPLAIIRHPADADQRCVAVELDASNTDDGPLRLGLDEARMRGAPLWVLTTRQSHFTDIHDSHAAAGGDRLAKAGLDHQLTQWREAYPDLEIRAVALHENIVSYLARNRTAIQLLVVGHQRGRGIRELVAAPGSSALHEADCSVLICGPETYSEAETNGHGREERVIW
jgi:nucleotide-binding universal stress UspA family protein